MADTNKKDGLTAMFIVLAAVITVTVFVRYVIIPGQTDNRAKPGSLQPVYLQCHEPGEGSQSTPTKWSCYTGNGTKADVEVHVTKSPPKSRL